jgi:hypothetical protein
MAAGFYLSNPTPVKSRFRKVNVFFKREANLKVLVQLASVFGLGVVIGAFTIPALSAQLRTQTDKRLMTIDLAGFCDGKYVAIDYSEESSGLIANHYHPSAVFGRASPFFFNLRNFCGKRKRELKPNALPDVMRTFKSGRQVSRVQRF